MHQAIDIIFFNIGSTEVLNFENIFIIFHFLMPLKTDIFLALILRKVKSCKIDCFTTVKSTVDHKTMIRWLSRILVHYFTLSVNDGELTNIQKNTINLWSVLKTHYSQELENTILNLGSLKMSDRAKAVMNQFLKVESRNDALALYQSFKKR